MSDQVRERDKARQMAYGVLLAVSLVYVASDCVASAPAGSPFRLPAPLEAEPVRPGNQESIQRRVFEPSAFMPQRWASFVALYAVQSRILKTLLTDFHFEKRPLWAKHTDLALCNDA